MQTGRRRGHRSRGRRQTLFGTNPGPWRPQTTRPGPSTLRMYGGAAWPHPRPTILRAIPRVRDAPTTLHLRVHPTPISDPRTNRSFKPRRQSTPGFQEALPTPVDVLQKDLPRPHHCPGVWCGSGRGELGCGSGQACHQNARCQEDPAPLGVEQHFHQAEPPSNGPNRGLAGWVAMHESGITKSSSSVRRSVTWAWSSSRQTSWAWPEFQWPQRDHLDPKHRH